jgi:hypothetical protein
MNVLSSVSIISSWFGWFLLGLNYFWSALDDFYLAWIISNRLWMISYLLFATARRRRACGCCWSGGDMVSRKRLRNRLKCWRSHVVWMNCRHSSMSLIKISLHCCLETNNLYTFTVDYEMKFVFNFLNCLFSIYWKFFLFRFGRFTCKADLSQTTSRRRSLSSSSHFFKRNPTEN